MIRGKVVSEYRNLVIESDKRLLASVDEEWKSVILIDACCALIVCKV